MNDHWETTRTLAREAIEEGLSSIWVPPPLLQALLGERDRLQRDLSDQQLEIIRQQRVAELWKDEARWNCERERFGRLLVREERILKGEES